MIIAPLNGLLQAAKTLAGGLGDWALTAWIESISGVEFGRSERATMIQLEVYDLHWHTL